eukprot:264471-Amphidinium_carterae.1
MTGYHTVAVQGDSGLFKSASEQTDATTQAQLRCLETQTQQLKHRCCPCVESLQTMKVAAPCPYTPPRSYHVCGSRNLNPFHHPQVITKNLS